MSKAKKLESEVVERPDDITVTAPESHENFTNIKPFEYWNDKSGSDRNALVILNQSIEGCNLYKLWHNTELHVCADGGANRLYEYFNNDTNDNRSKYIPDYIVGDLDSLKDEVKNYYETKGSKVIPQITQYSTDFTKSMNIIQLYFFSSESRQSLDSVQDFNNGIAESLEKFNVPNNQAAIRIYILSGIGGRFDQTIHSISQLYILNESVPYLQLFFITTSDVIFLLKKGKNYVSYPSKSTFHDKSSVPTCGLLPLGNNEVILSTYGLKYDVTNWPSEMLGNVSSSNGVSGVTGFIVDASDPIVMNIETSYAI
ncbi:uncharacterized protein RJT21DRAFT_34387 [Scheffersomyces amazonensis]|uniref:uncharacterized protein n=1 Tax=Scheffersomyces amazonensis TaxID=1078765 RepID=UPI00315D1161